MRLKENIYKLLGTDKKKQGKAAFLDLFIMGLIVVNVVAVFLESYKELDDRYKNYLYFVEVFSVTIFTIEYILRIWIADLKYKNTSPTKARLKFIFSTYGIIDLIAIMPFFLPLIMTLDLRVVRALRLFRLLRIFKLGRHSNSFNLIGSVVKETRYDLAVTTFVVFILLIISSTLMFYIESEAQPEAFDNIGQALWWAVATLTTVGYGDIYPITIWGKILGSIIALLGIGIVALPTGIVSSAFIQKVQERKQKENVVCNCPHCGKEIINK